jgi:hypothetical protein
MRRVKNSFLLFALLVSLAACSQAPVIATATSIPTETFTPYVGGTETAQAFLTPTPWLAGTETAIAVASSSPTPWISGTETAIAIASSSPTPWVAGTETAFAAASRTPTPLALPTISFPTAAATLPPLSDDGTFSPVLYAAKNGGAFLLVGGFKKDRGWLSSADASAYVNSETSYDFFSPSASIQAGGGAFEFSPTCRNTFLRSSAVMPDRMVGVASGWIPEKRITRELSSDDPAYLQAINDWFQSQGNAPTAIHITRILQVDLEGDGTNEVLISAAYFKDGSGHMTETGDYSVVLMRKVIGDQVLTIPLVKDYYVSSVPAVELSYPYTYTLVDAVDLNHDGTLEVVVEVSRWEGGGAIVYRIDGQNVREVVRSVC